MYDLAVLIGRFQPFHNGHLDLVEQALASAARLLVVIGSADAARRPDQTPFTADERREMILAALKPQARERVTIASAPDFGDLALWSQAVRGAVSETGLPDAAEIALVGHVKDPSSYYLAAFPEWTFLASPARRNGLSATQLRKAYFDGDPAVVDTFLAETADHPLPDAVRRWLIAFRATPAYADLAEEWAFARRYRAAWDAAPYPPVYVTADAVVIHRRSVLLIQRKSRPGKGLWALPGGFLDSDEFIVDAALRELIEETALDIAEEDLRRSIVTTRVFDAPCRDIRGRTVTHATLFHLPADGPQPGATAADDAAQARWTPLDELRGDQLYGDHFQIIQAFVRLIDRRSAP